MQSEHRSFAIFGGDDRQRYAAEYLRNLGHTVRSWGLFPQDSPQWRELFPADAVLLPLPASADGVHIASPLCPVLPRLRFSLLVAALSPGTVVFGGKLPDVWLRDARAHGLEIIDYAEDDVFQTRNALPTVEGAILLALDALPQTLSGTVAAVTGYGRIASLLADRLRALGADTVVMARKARDLTAAQIRGHRTVRLSAGEPALLPPGCLAVFNTVPAQIFDRASLENFAPGCVYIELASLPGGIDPAAANARGIRVIHGGGLPGRYFPCSAGVAVAETVLSLFPTSNRKEDPSC